MLLLSHRSRPDRRRLAGRSERAIAQASGDERGFIMIITVLILAALLVLSAAVSGSAGDLSGTTDHVEASVQATAAANAGVQVALYQLDSTASKTTVTGSMGNGPTYEATITSLTSSSSPCTGLWVQNTAQPVQQDCVTSVGTSDGVNEQEQARVVGYTPVSLFPVNGLFAVNGFSAANNVGGTTSLGSNGVVDFGNTVSLAGNVEYLAGDLEETNSACSGSCVPVQESQAITVPSLAASYYTTARAANNDAAINWNPTTNLVSGTTTYTASNQTVSSSVDGTSATAPVTIDFPAGTYYFCNINFSGNYVDLQATGSPVYIYIDSPYDTSSSCPTGDGNLVASNSLDLLAQGATPSTPSTATGGLEVLFYGQPGCTTSCPNNFTPNSLTVSGDIFAPSSSATLGGPLTMYGDMVVGALTANNTLTFNYIAPPAGTGVGSSSTDFYPARQALCSAASTPTTSAC